MADVDEEKKTITATTTRDKWKTWAVWVLAIAVAGLLYYQFNVAENFKININGQQIIIGLLILGAFAYWYFKQGEKKELPRKDKLALEVADWYFKAGYGYLDFTECEVEVVAENRAVCYVPSLEKTFTYEAGKGVIGERWKDIEETLIDRERSSTIKQFEKALQKNDNLKQRLEAGGFEVD